MTTKLTDYPSPQVLPSYNADLLVRDGGLGCGPDPAGNAISYGTLDAVDNLGRAEPQSIKLSCDRQGMLMLAFLSVPSNRAKYRSGGSPQAMDRLGPAYVDACR